MNIHKIGSIEAIALLCIVIANQILLNIPETIIQSTGSSAWLNVIFISLIALGFTLLVCKLFDKFAGKDILDIAEYIGGKTLSFILGVLYLGIIILIVGTLIQYFSEALKIIYFSNTPIYLITFIFILSAIMANHIGAKSISNINLIILPLGLIGMLIIFASTAKNFELERIFPVLGYGARATFFSGISNLFAFGGIAFLYFIMPFLKNYKDFKKISVISIVISSVYLFMSVTSMLLVFSYVSSSDQTIAIYSLARTIEYGRFFQRTDALFILVWILLVMSCTSILIALAIIIFKKITRVSNSKQVICSFATLIFTVCLFIQNADQGRFFYETIFRYYELILVFVVSLIILVIGNLKIRKNEQK